MARGSSLREILRLNPKHLHSSATYSPPPPPSADPCRRISLYHPSLRPLQTCRNMRQLFQIQAHLLVTGLFQDPFVASRVLKFSADSGNVDYTVLIVHQIDPLDAFCVNTVVKSYSKSSDPRLAVVFYFEMLRKGFVPNSFTFPPLANSCAKVPSLNDGEKCHGQAVKNGVADVINVQNSMINMYASCGSVDRARSMFDGIPHKDVISWNSMVDGYLMSEDLVSARKMFDQMPEKNVVSWNVMITGYLKGMNSDCSLELFREMQKARLKGSVTTMVSVLTAIAQSRKLNEGRSVHGFIVRNFDEVNLILDTALVDMYCKCGRVEVAQAVFDRIPERNLVCWNAMILGHCIHGCPEDGLALFEDMARRGFEEGVTHDNSGVKHVLPDEVTFVGVLCACRRANLLSEGKKYFHQMTDVYSIRPSFAHHWCMATLYAGLGLVQEAEAVLRGMPERTESLVWGGLLWKCRHHGDIELGERIAKQLIELEPYNGSFYALLWNVYAAASRWEDVGKVKEMMKKRGFEVMPGRSLVDLNKIVHNFKVGDRLRPEMGYVHTMMDELAAVLKLQWNSSDSMKLGSNPDCDVDKH